MNILPSVLISGLVIGFLYGLLGISIVVVFRTTGAGNFAAGAMAMFAAFLILKSLRSALHLGIAATAALGLPLGAAVGACVYVLVVLPLSGYGHLNVTFRTLGLYVLLEALASRLWPNGPYPAAPVFSDRSVTVGSLYVPYSNIGAIAVTAVLLAVLAWLFRATNLGLVMRAVASDRSTARLIGIHVRRIELVAWILAGTLAAVVGVLVAPSSALSPDMMDSFLLGSFSAVVLGGIYSLVGAVIGGLLVGEVYSVTSAYMSPEWCYIFTFLLLALTLTLLPSGLFGVSQRRV